MQAFRLSFLTTFTVLLAWSLVLGLPGAALGLFLLGGWDQPDRQLLVEAVLLVATVALVGTALAAAAAVLLLKVHVSPAGLRCSTFWGAYHTVAWPDIVAVRPVNLLGLRYLRVYPKDGPGPLWLPRFLSDRDGLTRLVLQHAGPDNPLSRALASRPN